MDASYEKYNISDFIGKRFGHLTVIGQAKKTNQYSNSFIYRCDCGATFTDWPSRVVNGHRQSCGKCQYSKMSAKPRFNIDDYIGKRQGKIVVSGLAEREPNSKGWKLLCKCDCGGTIKVTPSQFNRGVINSCGCMKNLGYNFRDGRSKHPLYGIWKQMMSRCYNPKANYYNRYGGRGISVCEEWHDFWNFVAWSDSVGGRPAKTSIDRIDNDGNYEPSNCRWTNQSTQLRNTSRNIVLTYNGKSKTLVEWSESTGIAWDVLHHRYYRHWPVERILTEPVREKP